MLFYIYLGTTAYVWVDAITHQRYLDKRLKKEGYKFTGRKYFGLADVVIGVFYLIALSIPLLNLLSPLSHRNKDRSYDEYKNYLDEAGAIELDETLVDTINKKEVHILTIDDAKLIERKNSKDHVYYSPMYRGEEDEIIEEKGKVYKKVL